MFLFLVALVGLLAGSPTRKVQTSHSLFSPTIVSNRRFSSDMIKKHPQMEMFLFLVALVGLEPTLLAELDFESSASTNSATGPKRVIISQPLSWLRLSLPNVHCELPCVQVFLLVFLPCHFSFQSLSLSLPFRLSSVILVLT